MEHVDNDSGASAVAAACVHEFRVLLRPPALMKLRMQATRKSGAVDAVALVIAGFVVGMW